MGAEDRKIRPSAPLRRVPGTRGTIDHIVVAPAGVFVVGAKNDTGLIEIRDRGGLFRPDARLYVGGRDRSRLADDMAWQIAAVRTVLASGREAFRRVSVEPVLCFVDGEWPLFFPPNSFRGIHLEGTRSIKALITRTAILDHVDVDGLSRILASGLPAI